MQVFSFIWKTSKTRFYKLPAAPKLFKGLRSLDFLIWSYKIYKFIQSFYSVKGKKPPYVMTWADGTVEVRASSNQFGIVLYSQELEEEEEK